MSKIITLWKTFENENYEFNGLPRLYCPCHTISVLEMFIEWETPQEKVAATLQASCVDKGPENPHQEIFFIYMSKKKTTYYYAQPTHIIPYIIQNYDLETSQFKITPIGNEILPKIKRISIKFELNARIQ